MLLSCCGKCARGSTRKIGEVPRVYKMVARRLLRLVETCNVVGRYGSFKGCKMVARRLPRLVETCDVVGRYGSFQGCKMVARRLLRLAETCVELIEEGYVHVLMGRRSERKSQDTNLSSHALHQPTLLRSV